MVTAVGAQVRRMIGERVLAAQFILNFGEGVGHVVKLKGKERAAAGGVGDALQDFVPTSPAPPAKLVLMV